MEIFDLNQKIVNRNRKGRKYFSFVYSYRQNKSLKHIEKGIGYDKIPNFETLSKYKDQFYNKIIEKRFKTDLDRMENNYETFLVKYNPILIKIFNDFGTRFTTDSNRIEGSQINLRETALLVEKGHIYGFKKLHDVLETIKHFNVYNILLNSKEKISLNFILNWHKLLYSETKSSHAGKFRNVNVGISGRNVKFPEHKKVIPLMEELIKWYNEKKEIYHPVLLAGLFKFKFVSSIHPFQDGNGRMSRLLMNYMLHKSGYSMLNIKYKDRKSYYSALERSNLQKNEIIFINWFLKYYIRNDYFSFYQ